MLRLHQVQYVLQRKSFTCIYCLIYFTPKRWGGAGQGGGGGGEVGRGGGVGAWKEWEWGGSSLYECLRLRSSVLHWIKAAAFFSRHIYGL